MERSTTTVDLLAPWTKTLEAISEPLRTAMTTDTTDLLAPWMKTLEAVSESLPTAKATSTTPAAPAMDMWHTAIESWKTAIYGCLEMQLAATQLWKDTVCFVPNTPDTKLGACAMLHFLEDWTRAQMRLCDIWTTMMEGRKLTPA